MVEFHTKFKVQDNIELYNTLNASVVSYGLYREVSCKWTFQYISIEKQINESPESWLKR